MGPRLSVSTRIATGMSTSAIGTLIQKIQCQESPSTIAPPTTGPSATPRPDTPDQAPIASPRRPSGTASDRSVSDNGMTNAAPSPWSARATISASAVGASAAAAEAAAKIATPRVKIRLRPKRSPRAAPVSRNTAKASV